MKKTISIVCIFVMIMAVISLAACGSNNGSGGNDISGTYKLTEMTVSGEDMTQYLSLIGEVTLVVNGDKATLKMDDEVTEMTVDTKAKTMTSGGNASPFKIEDNKLIMEDTNAKTKMVFEKQK